MSDSFIVSIKGQDWNIKFLSRKRYNKKIGEGSDAITLLVKKTIVFNSEAINPGIIRHELLHALMEETHMESAELNPLQIEEVCASILQNQWNNINLWTEHILIKLLNK